MSVILKAIVLGAPALAIAFGFFLLRIILKKPIGNKKMADIAKAISDGAKTYLNRQYSKVAVATVILSVILLYAIDLHTALGFLIGAILSAAAGYFAAYVSTKANVRTAEACRGGVDSGLTVAFQSGTVSGLIVIGAGLLAVGGFYALFHDFNLLLGLALGGSIISIFSRLGGGIFTKGADVGADLAAKTESKMPEDDPRNPGVIADNVGDNVGDCAGTVADLFDTYIISIIAAMLTGSLAFSGFDNAIFYPLILAAAAILASAVGSFFLRLGKSANITAALYQSLAAASVLTAIGSYFIANWLMKDNGVYSLNYLYFSSLIGLATTALIIIISNYYTGSNYPPVKSIVKSLTNGWGNNIAGYALSLRATAAPAVVIVAAILAGYHFAGIYGIAIAALSALSLAASILAIDCFGPVADNAEGIAKMAELSGEVKIQAETLDTAGNTIKAATKGYAIASTALIAVVLFLLYFQKLSGAGKVLTFSLSDPLVLGGLILGAALPYYISSLSINSVAKTATAVIAEIRRQLKTVKDYKKIIDIASLEAISQMILPAVIIILLPILAGLILGPLVLGGFLIGAVVSGLFLAFSMTISGGASDSAKKAIEAANGSGGKAAEAADIASDPYKDTAGPAISSMIKLVNIIAILLIPYLVLDLTNRSKIIIAGIALIAAVGYMLFGNGAAKTAK